MHEVSLPHVFIDVSEEQRGAIKLLRTQHSYHPIRTGHAQVQARRRERPGERRRRIAADGKPETTPATRFQCFARGLGCIEQDRITALRSTRSGRARASPARAGRSAVGIVRYRFRALPQRRGGSAPVQAARDGAVAL